MSIRHSPICRRLINERYGSALKQPTSQTAVYVVLRHALVAVTTLVPHSWRNHMNFVSGLLYAGPRYSTHAVWVGSERAATDYEGIN